LKKSTPVLGFQPQSVPNSPLEAEVSTLKVNRLCSKLILFIQDVNATLSLERKNLFSYLSPLAHIRNMRNDDCHYMDLNESELSTAIKL